MSIKAVDSLLSSEDAAAGLTRESLPRRAKDYKKDKNNGCVAAPQVTPVLCTCGSHGSPKCATNNCMHCCSNPSCTARHHVDRQLERQMKNNQKRKETNYYESGSSDEDLPLANVKRKRQNYRSTHSSQDDSSPSTDEEWTPSFSLKRKKEKHRKGHGRDFSKDPAQCISAPGALTSEPSGPPPSIRVPAVTTYMSTMPSRPTTTHMNMQQLHSTNERPLPQQWGTADRRMPILSAVLPTICSPTPGAPLPTTTTLRLPLVSSSRHHSHCHPLPPAHKAPILTSVLQTTKTSLPTSKYNSHHTVDNFEKSPKESPKENMEDSLLTFFVRYPYSQYCDQGRLLELFRPYCGLKHIQWIDKRTAIVTISEDSTFQTYDNIYLHLAMKSDFENNNLLYVSPYGEYKKKKTSVGNSKLKNENL